MLHCLYLFSLKERGDNAEQSLSPSIIISLNWILAMGNKRLRSVSWSSELNSLLRISCAIPTGTDACDTEQGTVDIHTSRVRIRCNFSLRCQSHPLRVRGLTVNAWSSKTARLWCQKCQFRDYLLAHSARYIIGTHFNFKKKTFVL